MNRLLRQLGIKIAHATRGVSITVTVFAVLLVCAPSQVSDGIVRGGGIGEVTGAHPFGAGSNECFQDQGVDGSILTFSVFAIARANLEITHLSPGLRDQPFPCITKLTGGIRPSFMLSPHRTVAAKSVASISLNLFVSHHTCSPDLELLIPDSQVTITQARAKTTRKGSYYG